MATPGKKSVRSIFYSRKDARGLGIIVTNDYSEEQARLSERRKKEGALHPLLGPTIDGQNMKDALEELNFAVYWAQNVKHREFEDLIRDIQEFPDYTKITYETNCIIFVFCGHGDVDNILYLQDGSEVSLNKDVIEKLLPDKCPSMGELQRLYFIDACRGEEKMKCVTVPATREVIARGSSDSPIVDEDRATLDCEAKVNPKGNYLAAFSTVPKFISKELPSGGIWLDLLAKEITTNESSILDVLTVVNGKLLQQSISKPHLAQQPESINRLNKIVYLHPNHYRKAPVSSTGGAKQQQQLHVHEPSFPGDCPIFEMLKSRGHLTFDHARKFENNVNYHRYTVRVTLPDGEIFRGKSPKYFVDILRAKEEAAIRVVLKIVEKWFNPIYLFNKLNQLGSTYAIYKCTAKVLVGRSIRRFGGIRHFESDDSKDAKDYAREDTAILIFKELSKPSM